VGHRDFHAKYAASRSKMDMALEYSKGPGCHSW